MNKTVKIDKFHHLFKHRGWKEEENTKYDWDVKPS